ncbi:hypothetical protein ACFFJX_08175 [Pseudarcicella hirudinis]|uniref:hypothetical protein n=1 Tax=Pseudarcicella hirudinis TaxID=1079859 RepID=UPI0035EBDC65
MKAPSLTLKKMVNESTIQNLKRLQYLSEDQLAKLERTAIAHKRYSNIRFNIVFVDKKEVVVEVSQGRSLSENYADAEGLVRLTKEMIDNSMLSGRALRVGTKIYIKTDSDIVTTSWIKNKMSKVGMRAVDVEQYMSIDKSTLSLYLNGRRELTRKVKSDFFHRLRALILDDVYIGKEGSVYSVYRNGNSLQLSFV